MPTPTNMEKSIITITDKTTKTLGFGFFISNHGQILTCYHLLQGRKTIPIITHEGQKHFARLTAFNEVLDLAILQIKTENTLCPRLSYDYDRKVTLYIPVINAIDATTSLNITSPIKNLLDLNIPFDHPNYNGLPVISNQHNQVIGIFNNLVSHNTCIPFSIIEEYSSPLHKEIKSSIDHQKQVYQHLPGIIIRKQVTDRLITLMNQKQYFRSNYIKRETHAAVIDKFLHNDLHLLSILGGIGTGKTTTLSDTAYRYKDNRLILFLSAYDFAASSEGIKEAISSAITQLLKRYKNYNLTHTELSTQIYTPGVNPLIIIDNLEDLIGTPIQIRQWMLMTIYWIKRNNFKLIISCTKTFFNQYIYYSSILELGYFNQQELAAFIKSSGLPACFAKEPRFEYPFLMHLSRHLFTGKSGKNFKPEKMDTTMIYYKYFTKLLIRKRPLPDHIYPNIWLLLRSIAKLFIQSGQYFIPQKSVDALHQEYNISIDDLIHRNFFIKTQFGLRINHKPLAVFLTGRELGSYAQNNGWDMLIKFPNITVKEALPWHIAVSERHSSISDKIIELAQLAVTSQTQVHQTLDIFVETILQCFHPDRYIDAIELVVKSYPYTTTIIITNSRLSLANKQRLLKLSPYLQSQ